MTDAAQVQRDRIFISYRRGDAAFAAGRLFDRLTAHFGEGRVFMDVDSISPGDEFVEAIGAAVGTCSVLLAVIGDRWLAATDEAGKSRLQDPVDLVRLEIETALNQGVRVIPVLVGAPMPKADQLPESLRPLVYRQAAELSPGHFNADTSRLLSDLDRVLARPWPAIAGQVALPGEVMRHELTGAVPAAARQPQRPRRRLVIALCVVLMLLVAGGITTAALRNSPAGSESTGIRSPLVLPSAPYKPQSVAFSPNGEYLAVGTLVGSYGPGRMDVWNLTTDRKIAELHYPGSDAGVTAVSFEPNGKLLAIGDGNATTYLWSLESRKTIAALPDRGGFGVETLAFNPGDTTLATGDYNGKTYLWNLHTDKLITALSNAGPNSHIDSVAFSPDDSILAVGDNNGRTYLWRLITRSVVATLPDPLRRGKREVDSIAYSPDGSTLVTSDDQGGLYLWNVTTRQITATMYDPSQYGADWVAFRPHTDILAAGDENGNTYLWNLITRSRVETLPDPHQQGVNTIAFSPTGPLLATGDNNGSTYLWHLNPVH